MRLSDLTKKTKKVVVEFSGESAEIEYRLHAVNQKFLAVMKDMDSLESIIHQIVQVVVRWEVLDDAGKEIPVTKEAIEAFGIPVDFLTTVLNAITDDIKHKDDAKND